MRLWVKTVVYLIIYNELHWNGEEEQLATHMGIGKTDRPTDKGTSVLREQ